MDSKFQNALTCRICLETFSLTDRRPRFLECGHILCTLCCAKLINCPSAECSLCRKKLRRNIKYVWELPLAPQVEDIIRVILNEPEPSEVKSVDDKLSDDHTHKSPKKERDFSEATDYHEAEEPKKKILLSEYCDEHLNENIFFCENHNKFVCQACCIVEHSIDKCKIIKKTDAFKNKIGKCHAEIFSKKKEFYEYKTKVKKYITILKKEEVAHSHIQGRLSELSLKHEEKKTYLESEHIKIEKFLEEQEENIEKLNSLTETSNVSTIQKATELTDKTANLTLIMKNKRLAEDKRCGNFKQLDGSIKERKSTLQEVKTITDTHEVEEIAYDLKGGSISWRMKKMASVLLLIDFILGSCTFGQRRILMELDPYLFLLIMLFVLSFFVYKVSTLLGKGIVSMVMHFAELVLERLSLIMYVRVIYLILGTLNWGLTLVTLLVLVISVLWISRKESNRLGKMDTAAWHIAVMLEANFMVLSIGYRLVGEKITLPIANLYIAVLIGSLWIIPALMMRLGC